MIRGIRTPFPALRTAAAVTIAVALMGAGMAPALAAPVSPSTSAYGIQILDADGGTQQAPAPLSEWSSGSTVESTLASTSDVLKLNTTQTTDLVSRAAADGAQATVASGQFQLRDRVPVAFTGLRASCATDGGTTIGFDTLTVDGKDVLDTSKLSTGYTVSLPASATWGSTRLIVGERTTDRGRVQVTALRIEAEAGWSEIWRVRLGVAACAPATSTVPAAVSGVTVTAPGGAVTVPGAPHVDAEGSVQAQNVRSVGSASSATDVSVAHAADGSSSVTVGTFRQVPDTSSVGEYMWSALRVYGLGLEVAADGTSKVTFRDTGSAVFVNGIWINTGTDLFTGLGPDGNPRVRVHLNERVTQSDGSIVITALRYEDLTGSYPAVSLGTVRWRPGTSPQPSPEPSPSPTTPLPPRYAFAVDATGPSAIAPAFVADRDAQAAATTEQSRTAQAAGDVVTDGYAGQIAVRGIETTSTAAASTVALQDVTLYPGTDLAVSLSDVRLSVTSSGTVLTTAGGTVAGQRIAAGEIPANTRVPVAGRSMVLTLNAQSADAVSRTVIAVDADDRRGLGAHVRVGVVTADAPAPAPQPQPAPDGPQPQPQRPEGSAPSGLSPGPIGKDDVRATTAAAGRLPATGVDTGATGGLVALASAVILTGTALILLRRRRRPSGN